MSRMGRTQSSMRRRLVAHTLAATAAAVLAGASHARAVTYYVSATGSDANLCTQAAPCREIRRALDLVQSSGGGPGDTIFVGDGSYLGFDVDSAHHGDPGQPLTIRALGTGALVTPTTDRGTNFDRDTIFITFTHDVVIDGLRAFNATRAGVRVDQSDRITIRNGVFGDNTTWGIFTDFSDDLVIANNECFGSQEEHGIYVSNSGDRPVLVGNRVHDNNASGIQLNADLSAGGDGIITGALIEGNTIFNNGVGGGAAINLDGVHDSIVRNNLLYNNSATGIVNYGAPEGDGAEGPRGMEIYHNTVVQPAGGRFALLFHNTTGMNRVRNNILFHAHATLRGSIDYGTDTDVTNTDSDYNVIVRVSDDGGDTFQTLAQWQALGHETHSVTGTLAGLFVNAGANDYHLIAGSTAINRGEGLPSVALDIEERVRPVGAGWDLGAYETSGSAPPLPPSFLLTNLVGGLTRPTAFALAPDGRLFVCEQDGALRVVKYGRLLPTPFVSLSVDGTGERGLIGVALDPDFDTNHFVYLHYTATSPTIHGRISRFVASGDVVQPGSEQVLIELPTDLATNHNGGALHFGADGKLYIAVGDDANGANSQSLGNLLGKMLRINPDPADPIPSDNPFPTATGTNRAIWALGLRNPFTFAFQPGTGRMFINDVGQLTWEEINDGIAGSNYGWPTTEGPTGNPLFRSPLFSYGHGGGATLGCAIAGGAFYDPATVQFPAEYLGTYFFADFCSGWVRRFDADSGIASNFGTGFSAPVDLRVSDLGILHVLSRGPGQGAGEGAVHRIQYDRNRQEVLWATDNLAHLWRLDGATFANATGFGGPGAGWIANGYTRNTDDTYQLLWSRNNQAQLWTINANNTFGGMVGFGGPGTGWTATSYHRNSNGSYHLLWTTNNLAQIWTLNADNTFNTAFGLAGPGSGWTATSYFRAADGSHRVLWTADNLAQIWTITAGLGFGGQIGLTGPGAGYRATSYQLRADASFNVVWSANNLAQVWTITSVGGFGPVLGLGGPGASWGVQSYFR